MTSSSPLPPGSGLRQVGLQVLRHRVLAGDVAERPAPAGQVDLQAHLGP